MARPPLEPGDRDRIVTIQQRSTADTPSTSGFPVETWTTLVAKMPASRNDYRGSERFVSSQESARYDTRWEINYRADMDPELVDVAKLRRLTHQGRAHDIVSASVIGLREGIEVFTLAASGS